MLSDDELDEIDVDPPPMEKAIADFPVMPAQCSRLCRK